MRKNLCGILAAICVLTLSAGAFQASGAVPEKPVRGIWAHPRMFGPDRATAVPLMGKTLDVYVRAGIDTVIMLVKDTSGYVYYKSGIAIGDPAYSWDFFGTFLAEAKKRGISVHPWFCVFPEGNSSARCANIPNGSSGAAGTRWSRASTRPSPPPGRTS